MMYRCKYMLYAEHFLSITSNNKLSHRLFNTLTLKKIYANLCNTYVFNLYSV